MNRSRLRQSLGKRFRLDPPAINEGGRIVDDIYTCERIDDEGMDLHGVHSSYAFRLNFDQVRERLSNPTPLARTLHDAEAILLLKVQVAFTPQGVHFTPIRSDGRRRLTNRDRLVTLLRSAPPPHLVRIHVQFADPEASGLADEAESALVEAGWTVERPTVMIAKPPKGVVLYVRDALRPPEAAGHLQNALGQCGMQVLGAVDPHQKQDLVLLVGPRP
jgi:hypothetical protein